MSNSQPSGYSSESSSGSSESSQTNSYSDGFGPHSTGKTERFSTTESESEIDPYNNDEDYDDDFCNYGDGNGGFSLGGEDDERTIITFTEDHEPPLIVRDAVVYDEEEMASLVSVHDSLKDDPAAVSRTGKQQRQPTVNEEMKERILVEYLMDSEPSDDKGSFWVFQRVPGEQRQFSLRGSKLPPIVFMCSPAGLTTVDVLKALYFATKQGIRRPHNLLIDDESSFDRLRFLFRDDPDFLIQLCGR